MLFSLYRGLAALLLAPDGQEIPVATIQSKLHSQRVAAASPNGSVTNKQCLSVAEELAVVQRLEQHLNHVRAGYDSVYGHGGTDGFGALGASQLTWDLKTFQENLRRGVEQIVKTVLRSSLNYINLPPPGEPMQNKSRTPSMYMMQSDTISRMTQVLENAYFMILSDMSKSASQSTAAAVVAKPGIQGLPPRFPSTAPVNMDSSTRSLPGLYNRNISSASYSQSSVADQSTASQDDAVQRTMMLTEALKPNNVLSRKDSKSSLKWTKSITRRMSKKSLKRSISNPYLVTTTQNLDNTIDLGNLPSNHVPYDQSVPSRYQTVSPPAQSSMDERNDSFSTSMSQDGPAHEYTARESSVLSRAMPGSSSPSLSRRSTSQVSSVNTSPVPEQVARFEQRTYGHAADISRSHTVSPPSARMPITTRPPLSPKPSVAGLAPAIGDASYSRNKPSPPPPKSPIRRSPELRPRSPARPTSPMSTFAAQNMSPASVSVPRAVAPITSPIAMPTLSPVTSPLSSPVSSPRTRSPPPGVRLAPIASPATLARQASQQQLRYEPPRAPSPVPIPARAPARTPRSPTIGDTSIPPASAQPGVHAPRLPTTMPSKSATAVQGVARTTMMPTLSGAPLPVAVGKSSATPIMPANVESSTPDSAAKSMPATAALPTSTRVEAQQAPTNETRAPAAAVLPTSTPVQAPQTSNDTTQAPAKRTSTEAPAPVVATRAAPALIQQATVMPANPPSPKQLASTTTAASTPSVMQSEPVTSTRLNTMPAPPVPAASSTQPVTMPNSAAYSPSPSAPVSLTVPASAPSTVPATPELAATSSPRTSSLESPPSPSGSSTTAHAHTSHPAAVVQSTPPSSIQTQPVSFKAPPPIPDAQHVSSPAKSLPSTSTSPRIQSSPRVPVPSIPPGNDASAPATASTPNHQSSVHSLLSTPGSESRALNSGKNSEPASSPASDVPSQAAQSMTPKRMSPVVPTLHTVSKTPEAKRFSKASVLSTPSFADASPVSTTSPSARTRDSGHSAMFTANGMDDDDALVSETGHMNLDRNSMSSTVTHDDGKTTTPHKPDRKSTVSMYIRDPNNGEVITFPSADDDIESEFVMPGQFVPGGAKDVPPMPSEPSRARGDSVYDLYYTKTGDDDTAARAQPVSDNFKNEVFMGQRPVTGYGFSDATKPNTRSPRIGSTSNPIWQVVAGLNERMSMYSNVGDPTALKRMSDVSMVSRAQDASAHVPSSKGATPGFSPDMDKRALFMEARSAKLEEHPLETLLAHPRSEQVSRAQSDDEHSFSSTQDSLHHPHDAVTVSPGGVSDATEEHEDAHEQLPPNVELNEEGQPVQIVYYDDDELPEIMDRIASGSNSARIEFRRRSAYPVQQARPSTDSEQSEARAPTDEESNLTFVEQSILTLLRPTFSLKMT